MGTINGEKKIVPLVMLETRYDKDNDETTRPQIRSVKIAVFYLSADRNMFRHFSTILFSLAKVNNTKKLIWTQV